MASSGRAGTSLDYSIRAACGSIRAMMSLTVHTRSVSPAAIAGVAEDEPHRRNHANPRSSAAAIKSPSALQTT